MQVSRRYHLKIMGGRREGNQAHKRDKVSLNCVKAPFIAGNLFILIGRFRLGGVKVGGGGKVLCPRSRRK